MNEGQAEETKGPVPQPTSESLAETFNNVMRHRYKPLSDHEKIAMNTVKDIGLLFYELLDAIGDEVPRPAGKPGGSRELSLAKTKVEEAVMWAVKHITA